MSGRVTLPPAVWENDTQTISPNRSWAKTKRGAQEFVAQLRADGSCCLHDGFDELLHLQSRGGRWEKQNFPCVQFCFPP